MTLCRRGRSVFRRTLVRGLVVMSVIGEHLPTTARLDGSPFSHVRNAACNRRRAAAHAVTVRSFKINDANRVARRRASPAKSDSSDCARPETPLGRTRGRSRAAHVAYAPKMSLRA